MLRSFSAVRFGVPSPQEINRENAWTWRIIPRFDVFPIKHGDIPLGYLVILGCARKLGSMVRISGLFHLFINGVVYLGERTH